MSLEEFKKKYGTTTPVMLIDSLLTRVELTGQSRDIFEEFKRDLKAVLES